MRGRLTLINDCQEGVVGRRLAHGGELVEVTLLVGLVDALPVVAREAPPPDQPLGVGPLATLSAR
jgi:hypothetical protein